METEVVASEHQTQELSVQVRLLCQRLGPILFWQQPHTLNMYVARRMALETSTGHRSTSASTCPRAV